MPSKCIDGKITIFRAFRFPGLIDSSRFSIFRGKLSQRLVVLMKHNVSAEKSDRFDISHFFAYTRGRSHPSTSMNVRYITFASSFGGFFFPINVLYRTYIKLLLLSAKYIFQKWLEFLSFSFYTSSMYYFFRHCLRVTSHYMCILKTDTINDIFFRTTYNVFPTGLCGFIIIICSKKMHIILRRV